MLLLVELRPQIIRKGKETRQYHPQCQRQDWGQVRKRRGVVRERTRMLTIPKSLRQSLDPRRPWRGSGRRRPRKRRQQQPPQSSRLR